MAIFKFVVSNKDGKAYQTEKDQGSCTALIGKTIGEEFPGDLIGLHGYTLKITGGSDKDGFPMRNDVEGTLRRRFLVVPGIGFKSSIKGIRKKKMLRGNTIDEDIVQINCVVGKAGEKTLEALLGKIKGEEKPASDEAKKSDIKEEKPKEKEGPKPAKKEEKPSERKEEPVKKEEKQSK